MAAGKGDNGDKAGILSAIRATLGRPALSTPAQAELKKRMTRPVPPLLPAHIKLPADDLVALFIDKAEDVACTVQELDGLARVPEAVSDYLRRHNIGADIRITNDALMQAIPWQQAATLSVATGPADIDDRVSVTAADAAVAETGTLILASSAERPTTLNFLPDDHIVVLQRRQIVASYEEAWQRVKAQPPKGKLPRTVNMITGPSRTGDIGLKIELGAHGPRRLHILLIDDAGKSEEKAS